MEKISKKKDSIIRDIYSSKKLIFQLAKSDFKTQFSGSYLGIVWAFIQPIVTVLVYWFVFEKGMHAGGINTKEGITVPFVLWLVAGIVPWFFFQDALVGGTNSLIQYNYLVKKVVFKITILPVVKNLSSVFVHGFFVLFMVVLFLCYGRFPGVYIIQLLYYSACTFALTLGLSYFTAAIVVFFRDMSQIISICLQVMMWMTPIMWNFDALAGNLSRPIQMIFKLNPVYYIVNGYRDTMINQLGFWNHPKLTCYFWGVTLGMLAFGMRVFKKLKTHFADVL